MIVVETRLQEVLSGLPVINIDYKGVSTPFPHRFDWGTREDLNIFLQQEKKIYPLIWLETGFNESHSRQDGSVSVSISLKIATYGLDNTLLNQQRLNLTFKEVLFPMLDNIRKAFERSNVVQIDGDSWDLEKFYNYGTGSSSETTDWWDALKFDINLKITDDCIKPVNYG